MVFADVKDGMLGMRVARQLEQPSNEPQVFTDAAGRATPVPVMDNTGVTGEYRSSEGKKGDAVWGTRGRWTMLAGKIKDAPITIAMIDHPKNPGYPTYWHARAYGLLAANPFGVRQFTGDRRQDGRHTIPAGGSLRLRYRVIVHHGTAAEAAVADAYRQFAMQ